MKPYTHCTTLVQVREVLRNYDGHLLRDSDGDGYWIDVDLDEIHGSDRKAILRAANQLFRQNGWRSARDLCS